MNDKINQAKDDLSYMKQLASDDGSVLRASGIGLMVAGIIFPLIGLRQFLIDQGWLDWPDALEPVMPFDGVILFFTILFVCFFLDGKGKATTWPPRTNAVSKAMWASWAAVGFGYLAVAIGMGQAGMPELAPLTLLAFWGGGWLVVWAIYRNAWLLIVALGCYASTIVMGVLWDSEIRSLVMPIIFMALVALPGFVIYRTARAIG